MAGKPIIPKFSLAKVQQASSQDVDGSIDALALIQSLKEELKSGRHNLSTFVGNFQQLMKCEMGTTAFKQKLNTMPLRGDIAVIGLFINSSGHIAPNQTQTSAIEAVAREWCSPVFYAEVRGLLLNINMIKYGQDNSQQRSDAAEFLIDQLLIPILQSLS